MPERRKALTLMPGLLPALLGLAFIIAPWQLHAASDTDAPASRIVEGSGGVPLVVQEWGNREGMPVLLLHGFSFGALAFKNQIGDIAEDIHFVAPDLRGHGLSAKPWNTEAYAGTEVWAEDIARIIADFELEKPVIVGWSFGGYVALNYLRHCGADCASGLVLVGSLAGVVPPAPRPDPEEIGLPPMKGNARVDDYHQLFDNAQWMARVMTYEEPSPRELLQKQLNIVMMSPLVRRAIGEGLSLDNRDLAAELTLPTLLIHGEKDTSVPGYKIAEAISVLPDATGLPISNTGHSPFAEAPELFNAALLDFVKTRFKARVNARRDVLD